MKKAHRILVGLAGIVVIILIVAQLTLPVIVTNFINHKLKQVNGYNGHIGSVSLSILAGQASVHNLDIEKTSAQGVKPVIQALTATVKLNWTDLFEGKLETTVTVDSPQLHFIFEKPSPKPAAETEMTPSQAWRFALSQLVPLRINNIIIHNGLVHYQNRIEQPEFDVTLSQIELSLQGLQVKPSDDQPLPAYLRLDAKAFNQADIDLNLHFNPYAKTPTFKLEAQMENLQLNQLDDFLKHYTKLQAKAGSFSFYLEAAAKDNKITGYIKPFMQGLKLQTPPEDQSNILKKAYKGAAQVANDILKNDNTNSVATQVDIAGNINEPDASIWSVIVNLLQNAFLRALLPGIDHSIKFSGA